MRVGKIDVTKIDKNRLFKGKKGTYLDLVFHDNQDGRDEYGNDGFVTQGIPKEAREAGERGPILGNWREVETGNQRPPKQQKQESHVEYVDEDDNDEIPF